MTPGDVCWNSFECKQYCIAGENRFGENGGGDIGLREGGRWCVLCTKDGPDLFYAPKTDQMHQMNDPLLCSTWFKCKPQAMACLHQFSQCNHQQPPTICASWQLGQSCAEDVSSKDAFLPQWCRWWRWIDGAPSLTSSPLLATFSCAINGSR